MSIVLKAKEATFYLQDEAHGVQDLFQKYRDLCRFQVCSVRLLFEKIELLQKGMSEKMKDQLKQLFTGIHLNVSKNQGCSKLKRYLQVTWSLRGEFGLELDKSLYLEHLVNCRQGGDRKIISRINKLIDEFSFQLKDGRRKQFLVHQQEEFLKKSHPNFYDALKGNLKKKEIILALSENAAEPSNSELIEMITELQAIILPSDEFSNFIAATKEAFQASHNDLLNRFTKSFTDKLKLTVKQVQSPLAYAWPKPIIEIQAHQLINEYHINNQRWLPFDKLQAEGLKERFYYLKHNKMVMLIVWKRLGIQVYFVNRKQKYDQFIQQLRMKFLFELTQNIQVSRFFKFDDDSGLSLLYCIAKYAGKSGTSQMITDEDFSKFIKSKLVQRKQQYMGALEKFNQLIEKQQDLLSTSNQAQFQEKEEFLERVYSLDFLKLLQGKHVCRNQEDLDFMIEVLDEGKKLERKAFFTIIKKDQNLLRLVISKDDKDLVYTTEKNLEIIPTMGFLKKQQIPIQVAYFMIWFAFRQEWKIRRIEKLLSGNLTVIYEYLQGLHQMVKPIIE